MTTTSYSQEDIDSGYIVNNYSELRNVFEAAFEQAARGKGKERHAEIDEPFEKQQIVEIGKRLCGNHAAGPLFQAVKKIYESGRMPTKSAAIEELYGAINYIAAAIIMYRDLIFKKGNVNK